METKSMKKTKNLVIKNGTYQKDGQEKTRWLTIGGKFEREDGSECLKIDCLPAGDWDGWVNCWDDDRKKGADVEDKGDIPF